MKKILFSILTLSVFAVNVFAMRQISVFGELTTINNWKLDGTGDTFENTVTYSSSSKISGKSMTIGIDHLYYDINDKFKIGTRLSLTTIKCNCHKYDDIEKIELDIKTSLIPIMVGGSYNKNISKKFSLNGKLFCGIGLINFKSNCSTTLRKTREKRDKRDKKVNENSCCFVADFSVGPQYSFTKRFSIGLDLGYRFTPTTTISENIKIDFSGFTTALSLNYKL